MSRSTQAVWQEPCPDCVEHARLLRNLRFLAPFARPHRLPKWTVERSYRLWSIAWRHRLPAPRRAPAIESLLPKPRRH